ncbi:hypothetical protein FHS84_003719 [Rhizomicrobium electricum]|nr:hypothetical protein [Rhizomicrobium electricum]
MSDIGRCRRRKMDVGLDDEYLQQKRDQHHRSGDRSSPRWFLNSQRKVDACLRHRLERTLHCRPQRVWHGPAAASRTSLRLINQGNLGANADPDVRFVRSSRASAPGESPQIYRRRSNDRFVRTKTSPCRRACDTTIAETSGR